MLMELSLKDLPYVRGLRNRTRNSGPPLPPARSSVPLTPVTLLRYAVREELIQFSASGAAQYCVRVTRLVIPLGIQGDVDEPKSHSNHHWAPRAAP